jgi:succinate dehydrogenase / fumarate reductase cytochrome b subunit
MPPSVYVEWLMNWLTRTLSSSLGRKYIVAVTGLAMIGFLLAHLSGNLLVFAGPEAMNAYAKGLHTFPAALWTLRLGLIGAAVFHIYFALALNLENYRARPISYAMKRYERASWCSRNMVLTGLLILAYIFYHLAHFTFRLTDSTVASVGEYDIYAMIIGSFSNPVIALTYTFAMVVTALHLCHGISSLFQTLGLNHIKYNKTVRALGLILGIGICGAFITIPLAVMLGLLK